MIQPGSADGKGTLARAGLVLGGLLLLGGIFGIWLQGPFYRAWGYLIPEDFRLAFVLPSATTAAGCLILAPVILCSPLTSKWTPFRRANSYIGGFLGGLVLCTIAGAVAAAGIQKTSW